MKFDEQIKTCRKLGIDRAVDSMQGKDMITSAHILKLAFNLDSNQLMDRSYGTRDCITRLYTEKGDKNNGI